jgi:hypothetical protein
MIVPMMASVVAAVIVQAIDQQAAHVAALEIETGAKRAVPIAGGLGQITKKHDRF